MSYPKVKNACNVNFGKINYVTFLSNPVTTHNDDYFWIRDDSRSNIHV